MHRDANLSGKTCIISMDMLPFQMVSMAKKPQQNLGKNKMDFMWPYPMPTSIALTKINPAGSFTQEVDALITAHSASLCQSLASHLIFQSLSLNSALEHTQFHSLPRRSAHTTPTVNVSSLSYLTCRLHLPLTACIANTAVKKAQLGANSLL